MMTDPHIDADHARPTFIPPDDELAALLADWLPAQRWFAGRTALTGITITTRSRLLETDVARFEHVIVRIPAGSGLPSRYYQLWLALTTELPERLANALVGIVTDPAGTTVQVSDALHSHILTGALLSALAEGRSLGDVAAHAVSPELIDASAAGLVISGEQSNTSIVFGDSTILKLFRRLEPGPNPDAEVHLALSGAGTSHVAALLGELVGELEGVPTTLGVLTQFFANSADGWMTATASVRDLMAEGDLRADEVGGDFAPEAERLGKAVAEIHRDLAAALGTRQIVGAEVGEMLTAMAAAAAATAARVPELQALAPSIAATFAAVSQRTESVTLQRIHGDLHLGQTLRTLTGWAIIDFEGEPSKTLEYRRALHSPMRDVAGMVRSFDYAGHHLLPGTSPDSQHLFRSAEWTSRNRGAFLAGYTKASGTDPAADADMLRVFELDKAVYEVGYEFDHRPGWLGIPLQAVEKLLAPPRRQEGTS